MPAFKAYNAHDYGTAADRLTPLTKSYPSSNLVWLYLGVSQLMLQENREAYRTLKPRQEGHPFDATLTWYTAIAAQRIHAADARSLLEAICRDHASTYTAASCRIAPTLP